MKAKQKLQFLKFPKKGEKIIVDILPNKENEIAFKNCSLGVYDKFAMSEKKQLVELK